jgi:RNA polymerase sigma-70 factor (ECF subfamily)
VQRARRGEVAAFEALVRRHQRPALRLAYAIAADDAEDAVQEAFVKAFAALDRFRPAAPFRPWLLRIVANEARNRRRSAGRHDRLAFRLADQRPSGEAALELTPEESALAGERRRVLADAVAGLPDRDREVIACRWFAGLTETEMAQVLGCRPGTVKSRLSRALDRLRAELPVEALR